jgi:hypothetical protein
MRLGKNIILIFVKKKFNCMLTVENVNKVKSILFLVLARAVFLHSVSVYFAWLCVSIQLQVELFWTFFNSRTP